MMKNISSLEKRSNCLKEMLAGVTPELVGGELDWGADIGAEKIDQPIGR